MLSKKEKEDVDTKRTDGSSPKQNWTSKSTDLPLFNADERKDKTTAKVLIKKLKKIADIAS
jgi:hypothetical protein